MLVEVVAPIAAATGCRIEVVTFDDLAVDVARRHGASTFVAAFAQPETLMTRHPWPAHESRHMAPEVVQRCSSVRRETFGILLEPRQERGGLGRGCFRLRSAAGGGELRCAQYGG